MTLQQLKYAIAIADTRNITEASKRVFISQPSLTAAIHDLEEEMGITIFNRSNKGVTITNEGDEFLSYARQVFIRKFGGPSYDFTLRETQTNEIIDDIAKLKSEIGVLYLSDKNEKVIKKMIQKNNLIFEELFSTPLHVFMSSKNPLARKEKITLEDLKPYPYLTYEQGDFNSFYFAEEPLTAIDFDCPRNIKVRDRATLFNLLIGLDGYTICSGVISHKLNGRNIIARHLDVHDKMTIGYVMRKGVTPSRYAKAYIAALMRHCR